MINIFAFQSVPFKSQVLLLFFSSMIFGQSYATQGNNILKNGNPAVFHGVNKMSVFGNTVPSEIKKYDMDIVRECIDLQITSNDKLLAMSQNAKSNNLVLILAGFWFGNPSLGGTNNLYWELSGQNPQKYPFTSQIIKRWQSIALLFKDAPHVWLNPWNEPFNAPSSEWGASSEQLVNAIRSQGNNNIIVLDADSYGQNEQVFIDQGVSISNIYRNIIFSVHVYSSKWLNVTTANANTRIQNVLSAVNCPLIIGEYGDHNGICNLTNAEWCDTSCTKANITACPATNKHYCREFDLPIFSGIQEACINKRISCLAWFWNNIDSYLLENDANQIPSAMSKRTIINNDEIFSDELCMARAFSKSVQNFNYSIPSNGKFTKISSFYHKVNDGQIIIEMADKSSCPDWGTAIYMYDVSNQQSIKSANIFLRCLLKAQSANKNVRFIKALQSDNFLVRDIVFEN